MVAVTTPFAREQLAAKKAGAIAQRCGARVVLFNAFMVPQPVPNVPMDSQRRIIEAATRQRRDRLCEIAAELGLPRQTQCIVRWDYPIHEAIVREVRHTRPDVLIAESHRHGKLARIVLANTDWQLMRDCPCPLWFVRSARLPARSRWLVAVDPRHTHAKPARLDDRLLSAAQNAVSQLGGRVALLHAYETSPTAVSLTEPMRWPIAPKQSREFIASTTDAVLKLGRRHGIAPSDCTIAEGAATAVITDEARRLRADVLVMGAVSRAFPLRPVIGATAERVIDHVECDVFVVKPAGFRAHHAMTRRSTLASRDRGKRRSATLDVRRQTG